MRKTQLIAFTAFITTLLAAFAGCGGRDREDQSGILIYGGEAVADGDWSHVVALTKSSADGSHYIECSATLISPRHVLTAGHCLDHPGLVAGDADALARLGVYVGSGSEGGKVEHVDSVLSVAVHPDLRLHPLGNADIAVLTLKEALTSVKPARLLASIDQFQTLVDEKTPVKLLGFGRRDDGGKGRKFMADSTVRSVRAFESLAGADGRDACEGDSGGPGFVASTSGDWLQYGIVSRGSSFSCGNGGYMTNVAAHACWISDVTGLAFPGTSVQCASPPTYDNGDLERLDFMRVCRGGKNSNMFQRESIARLMRHFSVDSCEALQQALAAPVLKLDQLLLRDLSPLAPFSQIEELFLTGNLVSDPAVLLRMRGLKRLAIAGNNLTDPEAALKPLTRSGTRITGLKAQISNYAQTEFLQLCETANASDAVKHTVAKIKAKTMADDCRTANARLLMLTTINLSERGLTDLSPLAGLPYVNTLDLSGNPVSDLSHLAGLDSLRVLVIQGTNVTDVSPLAPLVGEGLVIKQ